MIYARFYDFPDNAETKWHGIRYKIVYCGSIFCSMRLKLLLFALLASFSLQVMATNPWSEDDNFGPDLGIELVVYPNPSNGVFSLDIKKEDFIQETYKVRIVNIVGQTVASKEIESNMETKFDLSTLPKGFYFVRVEVGKQEVVKRIVLR